MDTARIAALLDPYIGPANVPALTTKDLQLISTYINILQRWNTRINLTSIRSEEEIVTRHFGESVFAARHLFPLRCSVRSAAKTESNPDGGRAASSDSTNNREPDAARDRQHTRGRAALKGPSQSEEEKGAAARAVADVGSGAGFPGIPVKLWAPQIHLTLVESSHKKSTFLREVIRALTLTNIDIQTTRAEALATTMKEKFDVVTLRAVERFESILPVACSLVAPAGSLALLIGSAQAPGSRRILPTMTWSDPVPIPQSRSRLLLIGTRSKQ